MVPLKQPQTWDRGPPCDRFQSWYQAASLVAFDIQLICSRKSQSRPNNCCTEKTLNLHQKVSPSHFPVSRFNRALAFNAKSSNELLSPGLFPRYICCISYTFREAESRFDRLPTRNRKVRKPFSPVVNAGVCAHADLQMESVKWVDLLPVLCHKASEITCSVDVVDPFVPVLLAVHKPSVGENGRNICAVSKSYKFRASKVCHWVNPNCTSGLEFSLCQEKAVRCTERCSKSNPNKTLARRP